MTEAPIYLDYQATTPLDPRVAEAMAPYWSQKFGNPHSQGHRYGWQAREAVELARSQVAALIGADDDEIVFVSGATESCNLALRGVAKAARERRRIVTAATEHPAVLETARRLGGDGFEIDVLPVASDGLLRIDALERALDERTMLVSVMLANNEIGVVQPIRRIAELAHAVGAVVHTDATQAIGRMAVDVDALDVDLLSLSGHKFYGPNGSGALYVRDGVRSRIAPILTGGSQEGGLRSGTLPTPLVAGLGAAARLATVEWSADAPRFCRFAGQIQGVMESAFPETRLFGHATRRVPGNICVGFPGVLAERFVNAVADRVAVGTGAACSSGSPDPSHVLLALGCGDEIAATGVRISVGRFTTEAETGLACEILERALSAFREGTRQ